MPAAPENPSPAQQRDRRPSSRQVFRWLGAVMLLGVIVRLCQPSASDAARPSVIAAVAHRLGARAELVEFEWFEVHPSPRGMDFEALARVSASQPGDLHAQRYRVHGSARPNAEDEGFDVEDLQVTRVPDVPPEPRP